MKLASETERLAVFVLLNVRTECCGRDMTDPIRTTCFRVAQRQRALCRARSRAERHGGTQSVYGTLNAHDVKR